MREVLRTHFRPEFLNRVDEVVIFHALRPEHLKEIIEIQLGRLRRLLKERSITVELTDAAKQLLVDEGYEPAFGARPLKRLLQQRIADPMAVEILGGKIEAGDEVLVDVIDGKLAFTLLEPEVV